MRLTTRGRYAVTALLDVTLHMHRGPVSVAEISERQGISVAYLEQLFSKLRKRQLVASIRGPGGGYRLGRDSKDICVADVIDAVDEHVDATRCQGEGNCQSGEMCLTHYLWQDLNVQIYQFLNGISLADLVAKQHIKCIVERQDHLQQIKREQQQLDMLFIETDPN